jgi:hypothetical protein
VIISCLPSFLANGDDNVEITIIGEFDTRRGAEIAVEHVVQEYGVTRSDVFVQPVGNKNTVGKHSAGADTKDVPNPEGHQKLEGPLEVSVDFHGVDPEKIVKALKSAGATAIRTK